MNQNSSAPFPEAIMLTTARSTFLGNVTDIEAFPSGSEMTDDWFSEDRLDEIGRIVFAGVKNFSSS